MRGETFANGAFGPAPTGITASGPSAFLCFKKRAAARSRNKHLHLQFRLRPRGPRDLPPINPFNEHRQLRGCVNAGVIFHRRAGAIVRHC